MDASKAGPWELVSKIGQGPSGAVFEGRRGDERARVKLFLVPGTDARGRARILREARTRVEHPVLLPPLDAGEDGEHLYVATPLVADGATLRARLANGPLTAEPALGLVAQLAAAVAAAHEERLLHRNLKPENVLLEPSGKPWLVELGLTAPLAADSQYPENASYLAPEQVAGTPALVDARTDVWALGAILHEALSGTPAFPGTAQEAARAIREREPEELAPRDPREHDALAIVARCLEKDPALRYQSADELAQDCRRALRGEPLLAVRRTPAARRWRALSRRPALLAGWAAGATVLLLVAASFLVKVGADRARLRASLEDAWRENIREAGEHRTREAASREASLDFQLRALAAETREAIARDEAPEAIQRRLRALAAADGSEATLLLAGELALRAELLDDARSWFGLAARSGPRGLLGVALARERRGEEAAPTYGEVLERTKDAPGSEPALVARAALDAARAVELLGKAVEQRRAPSVLLRLAEALERKGDRRLAASVLRDALALDALDPAAHVLSARLLREGDDLVGALAAAERALSFSPRSSAAHMERALVLLALGRSLEAEQAADRALLSRPTIARAHVVRAAAHPEDPERVATELRRALELDPREARALAARAELHLTQGRNAEALVDAKAACESAPELPDALLARSRVREKRGERDEAIADLRRAIDLLGPRAPAELRAHLNALAK